MATPPSAKRLRLRSPLAPSPSHQDLTAKVISEAQSIPFPWNEAVPDKVKKWYEAFAKSHNTAPEYVFIGTLVTTAALMGPKSFVKVRKTYLEPTNLFAISVGFPGSGKSQAYKMTVREPLDALESPLSSMLVDDYTKRGLFRHLQSHEGRALLAHEEMGAFFDLVQKRQLEGNGERQLYCRLYDGGQWVSSTGLKKSEGRQETNHNCVCMHGYLQPQPFIERIYPQLTESDDGFVDRLLWCIPKTKMLMEKEVDEWCEKLHTSPLPSLVKPFGLIADWHKDGGHEYVFSEKGMQVFTSFSDEITLIMNEQWESCMTNHGNMSKDRRNMIRLSGIIHVLFKALDECLADDHGDTEQLGSSTLGDHSPSIDDSGCAGSPPGLPPRLADQQPGPGYGISEEEARMAVALTEFFQEQRKVLQQVNIRRKTAVQEDSNGPSLTSAILLSKGAFCTPRSVVRNMTTRIKPATAEVVEEMKKLAEDGIGKFVQLTEKEKAFYKPLPTDTNRQIIEPHALFEDYKKNFSTVDRKYITEGQHSRLLKKSWDKDILEKEYGYSAI